MVTANYQRDGWGVSPPATNGTVSELLRLPSLSMPWHQNTGWRIRRQREAPLKTLHSQYLSACSGAYVLKRPPMYLSKSFFVSNYKAQLLRCSYQSGVYSWCWKSPRRWSSCSNGHSRGVGGRVGCGALCLNTLTDSCGRMSCVRHPFRRVCTHSIYKCHPWPTWSHKAFSDRLLQTYNSR